MSEKAYWEPRQISPGDRVRVRLSPECRSHFELLNPDGSLNCDDAGGHPPAFDGLCGTVSELMETDDPHRFRVLFDVEVETSFGGSIGADFAAIELEPLETPE